MQCPSCQHENRSGAKFCDECSTPRQRSSESGEAAPSYTDLQHSLTEARGQQTATSEVLKVISRSTFDLQPVLDALIENAARLCGARRGVIVRRDGDSYHGVAFYNASPELIDFIKRHPITPGRHTITARVALERRTIHVADLQADPEYRYALRDIDPIRTELGVPMCRGNDILGVIILYKLEVQPFTAKQIELVETFADQAVIAIENVRLFRELEEKNRALTQAHGQVTEALEQQTATSEILRVISRSPTDAQPVFETIVRNAVRLCGASNGGVYRFDGELIHSVAHDGFTPEELESWRRTWPQPVTRATVIGQAIKTKTIIRIADIDSAPELSDLHPARRANLRARGARSLVAVPMRQHDDIIGAIGLAHRQVDAFSDAHVELLRTFADQAVIAIENVRLFTELQEKNHALVEAHAQVSESLEQQTATSEILRVISSSPTDLQPVFDAIVASAARLCQAAFGVLHRFDGQALTFEAQHGMREAQLEQAHHFFPQPAGRHMAVGRAVLDRRVAHIHDIREDQEYLVRSHQEDYRTVLAVPLMREGEPVGALGLWRREVQPFSEQQIELVKTFADQAVIAIENVRLFTELQEKNRALTEAHGRVTAALERQTATSEILRPIAQAQADAQPVFDTIVQSAARLCHAAAAAVFLTDGRTIYEPANVGGSPEARAATRARFPRPVGMDSTAGVAILTRSVFHVPDTEDPSVIEHTRQSGRLIGFRSLVTVPMLREGEAVGAILVARPEPGFFSDAEVELLKTFADQAVIAVENVRLFNELEAANRDLKAASQHKSEFLANMSHELRTPLNAIIGFSEVLGERMFGELNEKQEEYLKDIYASGTHLLSLINDILDLSKIEAGRMELELTDFDLPTAIDNALILIRERAARRGIALNHTVDERLGEIRGDERKVKQVLLNLLSNALKFTPEGGRVEVRAGMVDGMAEISVSDTGVGIAPEDQGAIFEEFRQVGTADKKAEGTGLGLALSRKFIELHGGRIWVQSQVGAGSTFTFTIPVRYGK